MNDDAHRRVTIAREALGRYVARNPRGGEIRFGSAGSELFTPVELLLVALGGCTAADVDHITGKRAEPTAFEVVAEADKVRDAGGNRLQDIEVTFRITFPEGDAGDAARTVLPDAIAKSHERLCTVGRTVELGTPVSARMGDEP